MTHLSISGQPRTTHGAKPNVPPHLRRFVVEQDYSQYSAVDQAVWRFVLLQTYSRLVETAHPAYRDGLAATGISVERIPSIAEMNEKLGRFGWGAVSVDGFIPPRAFQEFQACGILPIAADIRSRAHLVYTPAPDIIHEAAGHAPILPDPAYSAYLRRMGELGRKAFTLPEEDRVFRAIYALSEAKEDPSRAADDIARVEAELEAAIAAVREPSEASRLARFYWWTAEYGLVGRVDDYKIYGAGLLSSLWESHSCHSPDVRKIPLDERCTEVSYDITRPQPQLFVTPSFDALHEYADRVARTLASEIGGEVALRCAIQSREIASVRFASGAWMIGVLEEVGPSLAEPAWLSFTGQGPSLWLGPSSSESSSDSQNAAEQSIRLSDRHYVLTGRLIDGTTLAEKNDRALERRRDPSTGRHLFRFARGARVEGRLERIVRHRDGRLMHLDLSDARIDLPGRAPIALAHYPLLAAGDPVTAQAGAVDPGYYADTSFSPVRVPKPRALPADEERLLRLYERAESAHRAGRQAIASDFPAVYAALDRDHPTEWLLRWNLLESLQKVGADSTLARTLRAELERLEVQFEYRQPIASGLRYLRDSARHSPA